MFYTLLPHYSFRSGILHRIVGQCDGGRRSHLVLLDCECPCALVAPTCEFSRWTAAIDAIAEEKHERVPSHLTAAGEQPVGSTSNVAVGSIGSTAVTFHGTIKDLHAVL